MSNDQNTLGLVLGRFQPLHPGHLALIDLAFKENDKVVICIGSAQKKDPLTIVERHERMQAQLDVLNYPKGKYRIVDLVDPEPIDIWPGYVKDICEITDETHNRFYRGEELPERYATDLEQLGFELRIIPRNPYYIEGSDGLYHQVSSASELNRVRGVGKERL